MKANVQRAPPKLPCADTIVRSKYNALNKIRNTKHDNKLIIKTGTAIVLELYVSPHEITHRCDKSFVGLRTVSAAVGGVFVEMNNLGGA